MYLHARDKEDKHSSTKTAVVAIGHPRGRTGLLIVLLVVLLGPVPRPAHRLHGNDGASEVDRPELWQEQPLVVPWRQGTRARLVEAHQEAV